MRNGRLKTTEGERWLPRIETKSRKARPTSARKKKEGENWHGWLHGMRSSPDPSLFEKVGLACETADRDEERNGKQ